MEFSNQFTGLEEEIVDLFTATFTASEGAEEGALIGDLVRNLLSGTAPADIYVFTAVEDKTILGAAIFTRLTYAQDPRTVFILSPMAVAVERQGQGLGQSLLTRALAALREAGVDVVVSYGAPAFYGKVGFMPLLDATAHAPLPLSHPEGWIGQSLTGKALTALQGPSSCVGSLNNPAFW